MRSWLRFGKGLLSIGALVAISGVAQADCGCGSPCGGATQMVTVTVCQMVPRQEQVQVTKYRWEPRQENYTAYRCEMVPEKREVSTTVMVPRWETVNQQVTRCRVVPYQEQREVTVMRCVPTQQQVTVTRCVPEQVQVMQTVCVPTQEKQMVTRCVPRVTQEKVNRTVDRGHCEQRVVAYAGGCGGCGSGCGGCASACGGCGGTTTVNVWVPNLVNEQVDVNVCRWVEEQVPVNVTVMRTEQRPVNVTRLVPRQFQENVTVMSWQPEKQKVTVNLCRTENFVENVPVQVCRMEAQVRKDTVTCYTQRTVAVPSVRNVMVCVPYQDTVTVTRYEPKYVQQQVAVNCGGGCGGCSDCGQVSSCCGGKRGLFRR